MHYRIRGRTVRSENAAKPVCQPSKWVLKWINSLADSFRALDYGCGKLRYTVPLSKCVASVYAVDSAIQIGRTQKIAGLRTSISEYVRHHLPNVRVHTVAQSGWKRSRYDAALCANVLSAIPVRAARLGVLSAIRGVLKRTGQLLVCTQFRNTYFTSCLRNPRAICCNDGWLVDGARGTAFYAVLPPDTLRKLCLRAGLTVKEEYVRGESAYVVAGR